MLLALILPQLTTHAQEIQHVVVVVGDRMPNGLSRPKQLVAITQNSSTNIADVSHAKFFGEDGSTLAFLTAALSEKTNEPAWHLLIIDSLKSTIIANSLITSDSSFTPEMMMTPLSRLLVVDSNISEVCFPTFDFQCKLENRNGANTPESLRHSETFGRLRPHSHGICNKFFG